MLSPPSHAAESLASLAVPARVSLFVAFVAYLQFGEGLIGGR